MMNLNHLDITPEEAIEIHRLSSELFGGAKGIRDFGLFESAIARPQMGYYENLLDKAAAFFESLVMNHPFVDGNKRVGWFVMATYLYLQGRKIRKEWSDSKIHEWFIANMELGIFNHKYIKNWLKLSLGRIE